MAAKGEEAVLDFENPDILRQRADGATDAVITLSELHCVKESDGTGHSEPYLWPVLVWIDGDLVVRASAPALGNARVVIKQDMRSGETAAIPASIGGVLRLRLDESVTVRGMFLVAALWEHDESPGDAVRAGFLAFQDELRDAVADNLLGLSEPVSRDATIAIINTRVRDRVTSAIEDALTTEEKLRILAGTLNLDDIVGSDFKNLSDLASTPITLRFAGDTGGRLLSFGDTGTPGNVSSPVVVGFGGWADFKFLFSGGNLSGESRVYAVDTDGQLLSFGDSGTPGNVSSPVVVGFGGWADFKFLFSGRNFSGENRIYAVDTNGQLLSFGDTGTPGNVSSPVVVGLGGWADFKSLFSGGNGTIYAVDELKTRSEFYEVHGELRVGPVAIDRCQAEVDRLQAAHRAVADVEAEIERLQTALSTASPTEKPDLVAAISRLRREDLAAAKANVDDARRALQACRSADV